jgi:pyruvate dehydrogenase E2 component (dihydrolipoamide acetyltransferase)
VKSIVNPDLGTMVDAVVQLMDHLTIDKAHLVGHSMGGLVSGKTAIDHGGRVASLTLICSAGLGDEINSEYIEGFVSSASRKDLKTTLKHLFADAGLVSRSMVDDLLKYKRLDGVQDFLDALMGKLFANGRQAVTIASALSDLGIPIQVIWGEGDAVIPKSHANSIIGATVTVISGAGHMVQMENASRVNELIQQQL